MELWRSYSIFLPLWASPFWVALTSVVVIVGLYMLNTLVSVPYPKGVDLVREPAGATRFSLKTRLAYFTDCASLYREAYHNVSLGFEPHVIKRTSSR